MEFAAFSFRFASFCCSGVVIVLNRSKYHFQFTKSGNALSSILTLNTFLPTASGTAEQLSDWGDTVSHSISQYWGAQDTFSY